MGDWLSTLRHMKGSHGDLRLNFVLRYLEANVVWRQNVQGNPGKKGQSYATVVMNLEAEIEASCVELAATQVRMQQLQDNIEGIRTTAAESVQQASLLPAPCLGLLTLASPAGE
jgi:hypothetical protein